MTTANPQHRAFIQSYLRTADKRLAYKAAYPDIADGDSLRVASNRLFRQLKPEIDKLEARATELAIEEMMTDAKERIKADICSMQQRREVLADLILGRMKVKRHIKLKDHIVEVEDDVAPGALIRAIDLDSKLAANKYKEKITIAEPVVPLAPKDIQLPYLEQFEINLKKYPFGHEFWKGKRMRLTGLEIQKFGFDILDDGIPYLKGELTEAFKEMRLQKDIEDFKKHYPAEAKELFKDNPLPAHPEIKEAATPVITNTAPIVQEEVRDLWLQYLKLDSNTRALHPTDRKQKEAWFRAIPLKQQQRLLALYRKAG